MNSIQESASTRHPSAEGACVVNEFYSAESYRPEASVGYLMHQVLGAVGHEIARQLEPSGLTNAQWKPLFKLHTGKASTVAELARECHLDAGAMTRLLDRLEAKNLCRRVRSVADRRVVNIELTEAGRVAAAGIPAVLSRVQNSHLAGFTVQEHEALKGFLQRILVNAQAQTPASTPSDSGAHDAA